MKIRLVMAGCFSIFVLLACTKTANVDTDTDSNGTGRLSNFSVTVLERTSANAVIQWDSSVNKINSEPVKYKVILNNVLLKDSLIRLTDTIRNLEKNKTYAGKVVAYISTGDTIFSEFALPTYEGSIYAYSRNGFGTSRFGGFNAYPIIGLQNQPSIWRFNTGTTLTPTLSNDTLFLVTDTRLVARSAASGNIIWQGPANTGFNMPVTYHRGKLYGCSTAGELVCISSSNGQILWTYKSTYSYVIFNSMPVLNDNMVFVASANSSSGEIHGVDAISGKKIWMYPINNSICKRPLAIEGVLVISSGMLGRAFALDQKKGTLIWEKTNLGTIGADQFNPVHIDGKVMVHTNGSLYALELHTGREVWKYDHGGSGLSDCVTGNGMIYFSKDSSIGIGGTDYTRSVKCLDAKTGNVVWSRGGKVIGEFYSQLVFAKDKIYCLLEFRRAVTKARIVAFNATNGNQDLMIDNYNPLSAELYEEVMNFCMKRDGVVTYPSTHGNYE